MHSPLARRVIALVLVASTIHALVALWLSTVVRGLSFGDAVVPETFTGVALVAVTVVGLVALGAVPLLLYFRSGLIAPVVSLLALFAWAYVSSWTYFEPARTEGGTELTLYYDSLFGLLWFVPLAVVLLVGAIEYVVRRRLDGTSLRATTN